ncbi:MAG: hypothetical protein B7Z55_13930 [Planctomycetales bacterium 12-60-4]|nr:MAG: hypothetical protein B7Z55_13930 [Planctomycetales bacterium 12-60-4]
MTHRIRLFTVEDLPFGLHLSRQAGWNQTENDWRRFLALQPDGGALAECDGRPAGTVFVIAFGHVAWIAMMLVEASRRGQGIGRALMEQALLTAESFGARSIRLDATPLGQQLYETLGFRSDFHLTRYGGKLHKAIAAQPSEMFVDDVPPHAQAAVPLDARCSGADRRRLIDALLTETPGWGVTRDGVLQGFCAHRPGSHAVYIGPAVADGESGAAVLQAAFRHFAGETAIIDIPDNHMAARELAVSHGLSAQRPLLRMTRGATVDDCPQMLWASSGGEKG